MIKENSSIVVKVGTSTLMHKTGKPNLRVIEQIVTVLCDLMNNGYRLVLVTSGAIGVGVSKIGMKTRPTDTAGKQAAATIGQCELMYYYDKIFTQYGYHVGQLLITKQDIQDPHRRENLINTFEKLFSFGAIPVVNENDAVAVDEIVYGDNDSLSAVVAKLIGADALILLTETEGLFDKDPTLHDDAVLIERVDEITEELIALAGGSSSSFGTGGMSTKLHAAMIAVDAGIDTFIIKGAHPQKIYDLIEGKACGTYFPAKEKKNG